MEFKNVVFNAARDGKLRRLKVFLDHRSRDEVKRIISQKTNGTTPLLIAARNGSLDVCEYLIVKCSADIEQVGSVSFDGETIESAPPLWCASAAGHLNIVKLLVKHGALVNNTTKTNSTPLRAACFDGHIDIVKFLVEQGADIEIANRHGHTCLMIACYKKHYSIAEYLLKNGADVNRKSSKGNTALHDCAESGSLEIMRLLLNNGASMDIDSYGMTPLNAAALSGHTQIVELITCTCSKVERIDALELLGATYVDKKRDMLGAMQYWRRAMAERYTDPKEIIEKKVQTPIKAYDYMVEARNMQDLDELVSDPDGLRMQALLTRERILGKSHPDTSYYIRYRGAVYADTGNFDRCIRLWTYALDMQHKLLEPLNAMLQSSLLSFVELFSFMMSKSVTLVRFSDLYSILDRAIAELENAQAEIINTNNQLETSDLANFHRFLYIILYFIGLLCHLKPTLSASQDYEMKRAIYKLVKLDPIGKNGAHLIHLACNSETPGFRFPMCEISMLSVIELLLEVGASAICHDDDKNTPLHLAASSPKLCESSVLNTLLQHGAHLDARNSLGEVPMQIACHSLPKVNINPLHHVSLQCLCAQTIIRCNVPYKAVIPLTIEKFVEMH